VPYGSTTATMFGGCDKAEEMTEEEADRFGENRRLPVLGKQIQGGKRMNTPDARRIFEAIAMILSNRNDGVRVQLSEIKTKAAKAS
jgi:hypothetical protein